MSQKVFLLSSLPLMAVGALAFANPAEAAVIFQPGVRNELSISGAVDFSQGLVTIPGVGGSAFRFEDVAGNPVAVGNFGNFGVLPTSTGAFAPYINNGTVISDYQIRSFDIAPESGDVAPTGNAAVNPPFAGINLLTCTTPTSCGSLPNPTGVVLGNGQTLELLGGPFVTLEGGLSTKNPDVDIFLDEIVNIATSSIGANQFQTVVSGNITAVADNTAVGVGSFNSTFTQGDSSTSYSATFVVENEVEIPEPATIFGLFAVGTFAAATLKRKQRV